MSSERVCQFFLRGRCQRAKCEFLHPGDRAPAPGGARTTTTTAMAAPKPVLPPGIVPEKRPGFDSDDEVRPYSDDESIVSGFTEAPKKAPPKQSDKESMPPPVATEETAAADDSVVIVEDEGAEPNDSNKTVEPTESGVAAEAIELEKPVEAKEAPTVAKEASTFIASAAAESNVVTGGTPHLSRRVVKISEKETEKEAKKDDALVAVDKKKEIRRNSKGFERFEDYFSDSEEGDSTIEKKSPEKENNGDVAPKNTSEESSEKGNVVKKSTTEEKKKKSDAKETVADLTKDWDEDNDDAASTGDAEETIESIVNFIQDENQQPTSAAADSQATVETGSNGAENAESENAAGSAKESGNVEKSKSKEEWVTLIFGEDGKEIPAKPPQEKSVYDLDPEEEDNIASVGKGGAHYAGTKATPKVASGGAIRKKDTLAKKEGVTKIGNNVYFYTGSKEEQEDTEEDEEELGVEEEDEDDEEWTGNEDGDAGSGVEGTPSSKRGRGGRSYAHGRRKHSTNYVYGAKSTAAKTRRCGECEGCNREDCAECPACLDKPKFGGKGQKKQACLYRVCTWKNPGGKRGGGAGRGGGTPRTPKTPATPSGRGRGRPRREDVTPSAATTSTPMSETLSAAEAPITDDPLSAAQQSTAKKRGGRQSISVISPAARPNDKELPRFDPKQFKPGCPPPIVKKGDEEYHLIVTGVKDTGLCGKYWGESDALPSKRKRVSIAQATSPAPPTPSPTTSKRGRPRTSSATGSESSKKADLTDKQPDALAETTPKATSDPVSVEKTTPKKRKLDLESETNQQKKKKDSPSKKSRKTTEDSATSKLSNGHTEEGANNSSKEAVNNKESTSKRASTTEDANESSAHGSTSGQNRGVSCLADQNTQREVVVECFAPYDDHRWVNIGKERDGMKPDAVQYARALRPPYHLLSFLRIKGSSTKGMSCTDKNTMVFVVLEGEISVVLHTTEFNAKKGDSFYIPPKNYYNLINKKAGEAELSLIQFQYDGPLPTVSAGSQSGAPKQVPASVVAAAPTASSSSTTD